ncbi:MAG: type II secretion system F family protein, partial [Acidimicrobiia bacterium]|nr:type II secretion system F family protein [Acidimicrobiia bacterium]
MAATFTYKVRDKTGKIHEGVLEGANSAAVSKALREKGMIPLKIQQKASGGLNMDIKIPGLSDRVKPKDVVIFSRQFATMVNSGLSLIRSLTVLADQTESKSLAEVLSLVKADVEQGTSLSVAMEKHPKAFGELYVSMVKAGEIGGVLDETLDRLADMLEANLQLRSKIKSAMAYPAVVGGLIATVTSAMIIFVVPIFSRLYDDLGGGADLPAPTKVLVILSVIFSSYWWAVILVSVGGFFGIRAWKKTPDGALMWDKFKLKMPIFGGLARKTAISRFARTLGVLSRSGVPILQALDIVGGTSGNAVVARALEDVKTGVREGEALAIPMSRHDIFPQMITQMMAVGEETGALDEMLNKVSDFYDREVNDTIEALTSLIEPLLIVVMGVT